MLRYILLILIGLASVFSSPAQSIYSYSDTSSYTFSFAPSKRTANNKVLNQLALAHLKIPEKTTLHYDFAWRVNINYSQNDSLFVMMDIRTLGFRGDYKIKDFDISHLLMPANYNITLTVKDQRLETIIEKREWFVLDEGMVRLATFPDSLWSDGLTVSLKFNEISYSDSDYRKLELELSAIRDYYASGSLLETLTDRIQQKRKETKSLEEAFNLYVTGSKGLYLIDQSFNLPSVTVPGIDPLTIAPKLKILSYSFNEYTEFIRQQSLQLFTGNIYQKLAQGYINSITGANLLSRNVDYYSSPFYYRLYSNSITASQVAKTGNILGAEARRRMYKRPDMATLSRYIMVYYLEEGDKLLRENRYQEAVDLLSGALKFRNNIPHRQLSDTLDGRLAKARNGLMLSYAEIIRKALDKNLVSLAENYLNEVENYMIKYRITNDEARQFEEVYLRMASIHTQLGNNALSRADYQGALSEFTKALENLNGNQNATRVNAESGLQVAVRQLYNKHIDSAFALMSAGRLMEAEMALQRGEDFGAGFSSFYPDKVAVQEIRYGIAFRRYNQLMAVAEPSSTDNAFDKVSLLIQARELLTEYHIPDELRLDSIIYRAGMPVVKSVFNKGKAEYWSSEPDSALVYMKKANDLAIRLGLERYPEVGQEYGQLHTLVGETVCNKAKGQYNSLMNQATGLFRENKYNEGIELLNKARELVYEKATCGLTTLPLNQLTEKYQNPLKWNKLVIEAFNNLQQKNYREAAELIQKAEDIYSYYHLDTLHIANVGYYDLAMKSEDKELIKHACGYLISRSKPDQAFLLLDRLRLLGSTTEETGDLQEAVARNLGNRDIAETPDLNVRLMIDNYTKGDKFYTRFVQVYRYYTRAAEEPPIQRTIGIIKDKVQSVKILPNR